MPELQVGDVTIAWEVRFSPLARRKRIQVTPAGVEVIAPLGTPLEGHGGLLAYVQGKRRWILDSVRLVDERQRQALQQHYVSGAKMLYRGRRLMLNIQSADVPAVEVECRSRFRIRVPAEMPAVARPEAVRAAMLAWMKDRALDDTRRWARRYGAMLDVEVAGVRLGEQKTMWGSCGKDSIIRVHWQLVQAPVAAMEYVVAHEVCHLVERSHSDRFWSTLGQVMADWPERKAMLEEWELDQAMAGREV